MTKRRPCPSVIWGLQHTKASHHILNHRVELAFNKLSEACICAFMKGGFTLKPAHLKQYARMVALPSVSLRWPSLPVMVFTSIIFNS